jgi:hypothetical protein
LFLARSDVGCRASSECNPNVVRFVSSFLSLHGIHAPNAGQGHMHVDQQERCFPHILLISALPIRVRRVYSFPSWFPADEWGW